MSDFDKEAEREKLREKYGDEDDDRAATQQMSELLLQGATMTNRHCEDCGDPVFRHDGREFCPSCGAEVVGDAEGDEPGGDEAGATDRPAAGAGSGTNGTPAAPDDGSAAARGHDGPRAAGGRPGEPSPGEAGVTPVGDDRTGGGEPAPAPDPDPDPAAGGVADARRALQGTLTRFARRAAETEDPRAAREHLAAAREAAEALAALRK
jgi:uncharacterized Zn finger protein (UPF0148 family)